MSVSRFATGVCRVRPLWSSVGGQAQGLHPTNTCRDLKDSLAATQNITRQSSLDAWIDGSTSYNTELTVNWKGLETSPSCSFNGVAKLNVNGPIGERQSTATPAE